MAVAPVERPVGTIPDAAGLAAEMKKKKKKGVVIETFVPWCTRCVSLKPSLELLAECLIDSEGDDVSFLALDASDRRFAYLHSDDVALQTMLGWSQRAGFPSLFFLSDQVGAQPQVFEGDPTLREVGEWVAGLTLVGEDCMLKLQELFTRDDADRRNKVDNNNNDNFDDDEDDDCCTL
jgi:thiol-disulfide isomerase/thioredoxin